MKKGDNSLDTYRSRALQVMVNKSKYQHNPDLVAFYRKSVEQQFSQFPALAEQLLTFS